VDDETTTGGGRIMISPFLFMSEIFPLDRFTSFNDKDRWYSDEMLSTIP
jgi:hypothetical protein